MRRLSLAMLLCAILSLILLAVSDGPAQAPAKGKKYALLVGAREYESARFSNLKYTENDAEEMANELRKGGFEVRVLTTTRGKKNAKDAPTKANIDRALKELLARKKREDLVLVGLAGHGVQIKIADKDTNFYCPSDAQLNDVDTMVSLVGLFKNLDDCGAGVKLLLVDACRDEPTTGRSINLDNLPRPTRGTAALFSCNSGERSFETPKLGKGHGVFFHYVLEGLRKEARNKRGEVTWARLSEYVADRVTTEVPTLIGGGARQTPQEIKNIAGRSPTLLDAPGKEEIVKGLKPGEERSVEIAPGVKMVMCWIPAGKATLGSPATEKNRYDDEKEHEYETKGFWLAKYECTQEQYEAVMGKNPSYFDGKKDNQAKGEDTKQFPVETVSWDDCQEFVKKVNGQAGAGKALGKGKFCLPHEDEWEYAYRGGKGNKRAFYWGDVLNGKEANCNGRFPYGTESKGAYLESTTKVGSYEKEASHPWGLVDMSGNVWEWCDNLYSNDQKYRTLRGGCWCDFVHYCRAACRSRYEPDSRYDFCGFRLCFRLDG